LYTQVWAWTTKTADAASNGQIGVNSGVAWSAVTQVNVAKKTSDGTDLAYFLNEVKVGDTMHIQLKSDATVWGRFNITGASVDQGTWRSFPVTFASSSGNFPGGNNATVLAIILQAP
jgi:hypothetical protein